MPRTTNASGRTYLVRPEPVPARLGPTRTERHDVDRPGPDYVPSVCPVSLRSADPEARSSGR